MKRLVDILISFFVFGSVLPLFFLISLLIMVFDGWPILFFQRRIGLNGKEFYLIKFRSMKTFSQDEKEIPSDNDRISVLGRFLRRYSLDEIPSILNVLVGDISLVGPRPLPVIYRDRFSAEQWRRHCVKPGLTGWAQVNGRNSVTWEQRFDHDLWYAENRSLWLDLKILARTVSIVISGRGVQHSNSDTMPEFLGSSKKNG